MKRCFAVILLLAVMSMLVGCGSSGSSGGGSWSSGGSGSPWGNRPNPGTEPPTGTHTQKPGSGWPFPEPPAETQSPVLETPLPTQEPLPENGSSAHRRLTIEPVQRQSMQVDGVRVGDSLSFQEEPVISWNGSFNERNENQEYSFTAPRDGKYQVELSGLNANASCRFYLYGPNDQLLESGSGGELSSELTGNTNYTLKVGRRSGESSYTLTVYVPKEIADVTRATEIRDQLAFSNQENRYVFTPSISGQFRFDMTEVNANNSFRLLIYDRYENLLVSTRSDGEAVELEAGAPYSITVKQISGTGSYVLKIGTPKPVLDISGYDRIADSIQFEDQINIYTFTAPLDGIYRFELSEVRSGNIFALRVYDHLDSILVSTRSSGENARLNQGEQYTVLVEQSSGAGSYIMLIGYQQEIANITGYDEVADGLFFEEQQNLYVFTPSQSGRYRLYVDETGANNRFSLRVMDRLDNTLDSSYSGDVSVTLEAGQSYTILLEQSSGSGSYVLKIDYQG